MICKQCGSENEENAVFCKSCGKRLDGLSFCPSCGKQIDENSAFCMYCGQRIKTEKPAAVPAKANATANTAQSGAAVQTVQAVPAVGKPSLNPAVKRAFGYISTASVLALSVFALIFVFLIGIKSTVIDGLLSDTEYLYYYFGKGYNDIAKIIDAANGAVTSYAKAAMYVPTVLGTVITAVTLLTVVATSITAIVFSVKGLIGKQAKDGAGFALISFGAFIAGSLLILALSNCNETYLGVTVGYTLGGANIAGVVLCTVCLAMYIVCGIVLHGSEIVRSGKSIAEFVLPLLSAVAVVVILAVISLPSLGIKAYDLKYGDKVNVCFTVLIGILGGLGMDDRQLDQMTNATAPLALMIFAVLMLIVMAVLGVWMFIRNMKSVAGSGKKGTCGLSMLLTLASVLFLVFSITGAKAFLETVNGMGGTDVMGESTDDIKFTYAIPIVALVFSVVALGLNIAKFCITDPPEAKPVPAAKPASAAATKPAAKPAPATKPAPAPKAEKKPAEEKPAPETAQEKAEKE